MGCASAGYHLPEDGSISFAEAVGRIEATSIVLPHAAGHYL
jgi:hypothetical protein